MNRFLISTAAVAAVLASSARIGGQSRSRASHDLPYGSLTRRQIIQISTPLCNALSPGANAMQLNAIPIATRMCGVNTRVWMVDASDQSDAYQVHLVWNADSRALICVAHYLPAWARGRNSPAKDNDVIRISRSWLTSLGMPQQLNGTSAHITGHSRFTWHVEFTGGDNRTTVALDARTGDLLTAESLPYKPAPNRFPSCNL